MGEKYPEESGYGSVTPVTEKEESEVVRFLMGKDYLREDIFDRIQVPYTSTILLEVKQPVTRVGVAPGDIDIIIYTKESPDKAIAIEAKVLRVTFDDVPPEPIDSNSKRIDKFAGYDLKTEEGLYTNFTGTEALHKGIQQSMALYNNYMFSQTYIMPIILVDGRPRSARRPNVFYSNAVDDVYNIILDELKKGPHLFDDIGIIMIELVQMLEKSIEMAGGLQLDPVNQAKPRAQSYETTMLLNELHKERYKNLLETYLCPIAPPSQF